MIKAVIFDCFGVLATDGWLPYKAKYFGGSETLFNHAGDVQKQVDAGLATFDEFIHTISVMAGVDDQSTRDQMVDNVPNEELFDYIRAKVKPRYKLGMLSNAGDNWLDRIFGPEESALFDEYMLSYQTGFVKPDHRAYEFIANKLGVEPSECVFMDDQERYVTAARELGMKGVWYQNVQQAIHDLSEILAADSKN